MGKRLVFSGNFAAVTVTAKKMSNPHRTSASWREIFFFYIVFELIYIHWHVLCCMASPVAKQMAPPLSPLSPASPIEPGVSHRAWRLPSSLASPIEPGVSHQAWLIEPGEVSGEVNGEA